MRRSSLLALLACALLALPCAACGGSSGGGGSTTPVEPGPQLIEGTVDITAGTVTITTAASNIDVSGSATDDGGGNATVDIAVLNQYARLLFNLKLVITSVSDGTAAGDGTYQGDPYVYFGPEALDIGAMANSQFTMSGLAGTTFTFTAELVNHRMIVLQNDSPNSTPALLDSSGTGERTDLDTDNLTAFYQDSNHPGALFSPDGRFLYLANGNQPALVAVDMTTLNPALSTDLTGADMLQQDGLGSVGMTHGLAFSPDKSLIYTIYTSGLHSFSTDGGQVNGTGPSRLAATSEVYLVKIDRVTLSEVSRVMLASAAAAPGSSNVGGKGLAISSDGARAAVGIQNQGLVFVVDTATMTIYDADLGTMGDQGFDVSARGMVPRKVTFGPGDAEVFVARAKDHVTPATSNAHLDRINLAARTVTSLDLNPVFDADTGTNRIGCLALGPDGRLYHSHQNSSVPGFSIYDFGTTTWTDYFAAPFRGMGEIMFEEDGASYWIQDNDSNEVFHFGIGGVTPIPMEATGLDSFPGSSGGWHCAALSPF